MKCPQCATENPDGNKFCARCGAAMPAVAAATPPGLAAAGGAGAAPAAAPGTAGKPFPMLPVVIAGAVVLFLGFLLVVGAGAYLMLRHQNAPVQAGPAQAPSVPPQQAAPQNGPPQPGAQGGPGQAPAAGAQPAPIPTPGGGAQPAPIPAPPAAGQPGGGAPVAQQPTVPMDNYAIGKLVVKYPAGWHVLASQVSGYVFYKDDPSEGTSFTVLPLQTIGAEMSATQVIQTVGGNLWARKYRDFRLANVSLQVVQSDFYGAGQVSEGDASWTGARGQVMQGRFWALSVPGVGVTTFMFMGGQAPAAEFDQWRNVFEEMFYH